MEEIFCGILLNTDILDRRSKFYINRCFPISTRLSELVDGLNINFINRKITLGQFMVEKLGYFPKNKEIVYIGGYEFIYEDSINNKKECIRIKSKV